MWGCKGKGYGNKKEEKLSKHEHALRFNVCIKEKKSISFLILLF